MTPAQENAISKATEYLDFGAFSEKSLIDQLEYEGFKTADAKFAIKHIDVNWNEQAELKAREYLATGSFSRKSLTDQLVFEGFTSAQAKHGVDVTGL